MNCGKCGAPLKAEAEACEYCGTLTAYGEERRRLEREERKAGYLPAMKYASGAFVVFMWVITLGGYSAYWYVSRAGSLVSLGTKRKFPVWMAWFYAAAEAGMLILPSIAGVPEELLNAAVGGAFVGSVWLAIEARSILQEYASRFLGKAAAAGSVASSGVMAVIFGPVYLQHSVNRLVKMKLVAPKV